MHSYSLPSTILISSVDGLPHDDRGECLKLKTYQAMCEPSACSGGETISRQPGVASPLVSTERLDQRARNDIQCKHTPKPAIGQISAKNDHGFLKVRTSKQSANTGTCMICEANHAGAFANLRYSVTNSRTRFRLGEDYKEAPAAV